MTSGIFQDASASVVHRVRHVLRGLCAVVAVFAWVCPAVAQQEAATALRLPTVRVAAAQLAEVVAQVPVSGTLLPRTEVLIYPQVSGLVIDEILVEIGDSVTRGDVLARMNGRTLAAQLAQAEAEEARAAAGVRQAESQIAASGASQDQAEAALSRAQRLARSGNVSEANLDNAVAAAATARAATASARDGLAVAQATVRTAAAQREIASINLDHANIMAPADGLISARNGQTGAITAMAGEPLFRLVQDGLIEIEAEVIETALAQIALDDPATLDVAGVGPVTGLVRLISPTVNPANRLGLIRIAPDRQDGLRAGTYAGGVVTIDRHAALVVPATAVQIEVGATYVLQVVDGVLNRRDVVAGLIWQGKREIVSGLAEGDLVVARAGSFFGDGDRVTPLLPDAIGAEAGR